MVRNNKDIKIAELQKDVTYIKDEVTEVKKMLIPIAPKVVALTEGQKWTWKVIYAIGAILAIFAGLIAS